MTALVGTSPWMWILRGPAFPALSNTHLGQSCWSQTHKHHEGSSSRENTSRTPTLEPSETSYSLLSIILLFSNSSFWIFPFNRKIKWCIRKFPQCQFLRLNWEQNSLIKIINDRLKAGEGPVARRGSTLRRNCYLLESLSWTQTQNLNFINVPLSSCLLENLIL